MVNLALRPLFARPGGHSGCVLPILSICSRMRSPAQPMMSPPHPDADGTPNTTRSTRSRRLLGAP